MGLVKKKIANREQMLRGAVTKGAWKMYFDYQRIIFQGKSWSNFVQMLTVRLEPYSLGQDNAQRRNRYVFPPWLRIGLIIMEVGEGWMAVLLSKTGERWGARQGRAGETILMKGTWVDGERMRGVHVERQSPCRRFLGRKNIARRPWAATRAVSVRRRPQWGVDSGGLMMTRVLKVNPEQGVEFVFYVIEMGLYYKLEV